MLRTDVVPLASRALTQHSATIANQAVRRSAEAFAQKHPCRPVGPGSAEPHENLIKVVF